MFDFKIEMVNVAMIGCGYWSTMLLRNFSQTQDLNLISICDIDQLKIDKTKSIFPKVKTSLNPYEVFSDPDIDAVVLAVPVAQHYKLAKEALLHDKHVLVEKPMTMTSDEAKDLIEISRNRNRILMVDHTFEYTPAIRKIREIINHGELGEIYYISANWLNLGLLQKDVNVVHDLATHLFSTMNFLLNSKPHSIRAYGGCYIRNEQEEVANLIIKYPNKITVFINVSWIEPCKVRKLVIVGSKKMLLFDLINEPEQIKIYDKGVDINDKDNQLNYRFGDIYTPRVDVTEPLLVMSRHFIDCIKNNTQPLTNGDVGLEVVKLIEIANKSIKLNGEEIKL